MVVPSGVGVVGNRNIVHDAKDFGTSFFEKCNTKPQIIRCGEYDIVAIRHLTQENGNTWKIRGRPSLSPYHHL